jgi:hypothetical protein
MRAMAAVIAMSAAAAPALSQDMSAIDACATAAFGTGGCSAEAAREALYNLYPGYVAPFHDAGMESFAMLTVLSILGDGIANRLDGGDCVFNEELAGEATGIWTDYVRLPEGAAPDLATRVGVLDRFVTNATAYILEGTC